MRLIPVFGLIIALYRYLRSVKRHAATCREHRRLINAGLIHETWAAYSKTVEAYDVTLHYLGDGMVALIVTTAAFILIGSIFNALN